MQEAEHAIEAVTTSPGDPNIVIRAENVGKIFCRDLKRSLWYGLKDSVADLTLGPGRAHDEHGDPVLRPGEFWANRGISFEVRKGESLGLIGRNGAGKTTLLKMLNGLMRPDTGRIEMRGRVGALIALGAGFNPILTGRENIFVNGSVLGLSRKEIEEKFDSIVEFAELDAFIDTPVRNYSSGMQVRLGFAVASALSPQILLLDEVLAVGDMRFRAKCFNRLSELRDQGVSFILVTHQLMDISRYATRCLYLDGGRLKADAEVNAAIVHYLADAPGVAAGSEAAVESGSGRIRIEDVDFVFEDDLIIRLRLSSTLGQEQEVELGMSLADESPDLLQFTIAVDEAGKRLVADDGETILEVRLPGIFPQRSPFTLSISLSSLGASELFHKRADLMIPQQPRAHHFGRLSAAVRVRQTETRGRAASKKARTA